MDLATETTRALLRFKNVVLEGPPGVGKSHVVKNVVASWEREGGRPLKGAGQGPYAITLHPSTSYEEFVEGLRYDDARNQFVRKDGFLTNIVNEARKNPGHDFLVLVDELNRANVPKVFGDLLLTMEASKRPTWNGTAWSGGTEVTLPYSGKLFSMPDNVYLLGTMNSSDRSIAPLDSALRRRFAFVHVEPLMGDELRRAITLAEGEAAGQRASRSVDQLTNLNEALRRCLGPDSLIGHSYLFGMNIDRSTRADVSSPLTPVLAVLTEGSSEVFWLESGRLDGGSHNQLNLPDVNELTARRGIVDTFFPVSSRGEVVAQRSARGVHDRVEISFEGKRYYDNVIRFNEGGPNYKLYYSGETEAGERFSRRAKDGLLDYKVHVWIRQADGTLNLVLLERTERVVETLRAVSVGPDGWHEVSTPTNGRSYGKIDPDVLRRIGNTETNDSAERMTWRYTILPQLLDTATQAGATDLLLKAKRTPWLADANATATDDRWSKFDDFLTSLALTVVEEGHGLTRKLSVIDVSPLPQGGVGGLGETEALEGEKGDAENAASDLGSQ